MKKLILLICFCFLVSSVDARIRSSAVRVTQGELEIKNVAGFGYDYTNFQLLINTTVYILTAAMVISGNLNAGPTETIVINGITFPSAASVSLWYPGTFPSTPSVGDLVDFMQYGSAGHPHEALAAMAGYWTAGEFVAGNPPYVRNGGANDEGASHWQPNTVGVEELMSKYALSLYPNPASSSLNLNVDFSALGQDPIFQLVNMQGQLVRSQPIRGNGLNVPTSDLPKGLYLATISNASGRLEQQRVQLR